MLSIDINCDIGEGYGAYRIGADEELMGLITSANIACGFHAGDPGIMRASVRSAMKRNVAIGAHPGLPDREGFGRREMAITPKEAYDMIVYQIGALRAFAESEGGFLSHVKPHGALYNMAAKENALAEAIAEAVYKVDGSLLLFGLSGSALIRAGERLGLRTANEVFADRSYESDGSLTPRSIEGAVLASEEAVARQAVMMVKEGKVATRQGSVITLKADTICVHGDTPGAADHVLALRESLEREGISFRAIAAGDNSHE
ncbi:5-oxoprolinase subunit PxpA [Paenibacillus sp. J5C_2022]|uniref:LamB/YcsF family protein n=1 Tax=Paenibacillus sp. J5C2022 TaxID=2977129 RepID=UPI0021D16C8A|nr:5-oxoprolinase subunit PxpA [Paenibacillus sp. J5C2022]MCU6711227.1 5-oxoprolinase subunit PxpA [Paenibacillus sp. J5C2022]